MNCEAAGAAMDAGFAGELPPETDAHLHTHLETCTSCRERYERLSRVDAVLERGGLSAQRMEAMEARLLAKFAPVPAAAALPPQSRRGWTTLLAAAAVLVLVSALAIPAWRAAHDERFTPRGVGGTSWGVRAFCVAPGATVTGEALSGGTLHCRPGSVVQFTYTAAQTAELSIELEGTTQRFFERAGVDAGIDVALPLSTPVGAWLTGPQRVTARFTDSAGAPLAESSLTIAP